MTVAYLPIKKPQIELVKTKCTVRYDDVSPPDYSVDYGEGILVDGRYLVNITDQKSGPCLDVLKLKHRHLSPERVEYDLDDDIDGFNWVADGGLQVTAQELLQMSAVDLLLHMRETETGGC
ncbi:hypothetical protein [Geomicrobium sediminis]|uniref:Uncharacterized protein n=1 Tax=Geomicrobium sediminis TaxID=1347788 RepID=A0ABS2PHX2_9BACL|nr:hypothetical protein [Geomicrobium sediminis]MBM7634934.1 hypothetical protein [Geomicrobium sediminis]